MVTIQPDRRETAMTEVTIETGALVGTNITAKNGTTIQFYGGIPYAAPPVGELRWRARQNLG